MNLSRKLLALALALCVLAFSASALADTVKLKVWGNQENQEILGELIEEFKAANPDTTWDISLGVVGEPDAQARYNEDATAAADVFAFPSDHTLQLVQVDALQDLPQKDAEAMIAANLPNAVEAATVGDYYYGYPMSADNGYFLYYDKSVLSEEDVKSLDGILAAANKAGKQVFMDVSNGWYIASFFIGAGCTLGIDENGKQTSDFNNEKGLAAAEAIRAFTADPAFMTGDDSVLVGAMGGKLCAGVTGTWNAVSIQEKLGENYAACKLPTFTCAGEQVQMGSFFGAKLIGVNSLTQYPLEALSLAQFLTNEASQRKFFEIRAQGPSNINVASDPDVTGNIALKALYDQNQYAVSQKTVSNSYWTPAEAFGLEMENKSTGDLQAMLDTMVSQITQ